MPIGCLSSVAHIVNRLIQRRPKTVLDLGIGMGFYGAAIRQWLDMGFAVNFNVQLVGVEGFERYRNPCWDLYNEVYVQSIEDFLQRMETIRQQPTKYAEAVACQFDAVLLTDVLEHFDKPAGASVITRVLNCLTRDGIFIISTPAIETEQGAVYGNEFERHKCAWSATELKQFVEEKPGLSVEILQDGNPDAFGNLMLTACISRVS